MKKITHRDMDATFCQPRRSFDALIEKLKTDDTMKLSHDGVERLIEQGGREVLRELFQSHLDLRAIEEDVHGREAPVGVDGIKREHRRDTSRELSTILGPVEVRRISFTLTGTPGGLRPIDAELNLPTGLYSLEIQRRVADFSMDLSFETAQDKLNSSIGYLLPKRQMEEMTVEAARDFEDYYAWRQSEMLEVDESGLPAHGDLLILTNDGKGIVMRPEALREDTRKKAENEKRKLSTRLSPGEKRNRKRMAEVGSVYFLKRQPRLPSDIMPLPHEGPREGALPRPRPENKRAWASIKKDLCDVVQETYDEALARDPVLKKSWIYLVDGNEDQINVAIQMAKRIGVIIVIIIDFIHVLEYIWKAAWCFFEKNDPAVEPWVMEHARAVLEGKASDVAAGIRRSATQRGLAADRRKGADSCANYLLKNRDFLHYDQYLASGFPIASGVIEGTCRHLVNDRMGITGARWGLENAEAILQLRALKTSGDFDEYWTFHRQRALCRNHLDHYAETELAHLRLAA